MFTNGEIILTKNSVLKKTKLLLSEVQEILSGSPIALSPSPKVSKGENYLGLPYVVLDYPRIAKGENLFFVRSMFWWGNFFSSTLQLSGSYASQYKFRISESYEILSSHSYFIGVNPNPWEHHFGEDNYKKIGVISKNAYTSILEKQAHIKIAAFWPLSEWDSAANNLVQSWKLLTGLVT